MKTNYSNSVILNNEAINTYVHRVFAHKSLMCSIRKFLELPLHMIMNDLKIDRYLIGGTTALMMCYDIPIREDIKDIDVIVPAGTVERIKEQIKKSPFYSIVSEYIRYDVYNQENTHIEIKCIEGCPVDIIETNEKYFDDMFSKAVCSESIYYCPLMDILAVKNTWRRPKDIKDLSFIERWFETSGIEKIEEQKQRDVSDKIAIEEMNCCDQEPPETATFESINKMFDELEEIEIEDRLKENAPYKIGDVIRFIGYHCDTGKKEIATGPIFCYNKKYGKITIYNEVQDLVTYEVEKWIADLLK